MSDERTLRKRKLAREESMVKPALAMMPVHQQLRDMNKFTARKTMAQGFLDMALLSANASQMKYVLQFTEAEEMDDEENLRNSKKMHLLNNWITALVIVTMVVNVFITAFGISPAGPAAAAAAS
ncbi:hypothetical protein Bbelb_044470 [Branchiostoma belcheri]|nr:hypothetical protein Bbelb_044470 [Branchiostoma belcheri]